MLQYINKISEDNFDIDYRKICKDFKIFRYYNPDDDYSFLDEITKKLHKKSEFYILRVYINMHECFFMEPIFSDCIEEDNYISRIDRYDLECLPIYIIGEMLLRIIITQKKGMETGYYRIVPGKFGLNTVFTQMFRFKEYDNGAILEMAGHSFVNKEAFYDDDKYKDSYFIKEGSHMKRCYENNEVMYRSDKPWYDTSKNELKNAFDAQSLKTWESIESQSLLLFGVVCQEIRDSGYVNKMDFDVIDIERYEHSLYQNYMDRYKELLSHKCISIVFGNSINPNEKDKLTYIINKIFDEINNTYAVRHIYSDVPGKNTLYVIDENKKGDQDSDKDYKHRYPKCIIQHIGSDTLFGCQKKGNTEKYSTDVILNCLAQLMIKTDIKSKKFSFADIEEDFLYYEPVRKQNRKKRLELRGAQEIFFKNNSLLFQYESLIDNSELSLLEDYNMGDVSFRPIYMIKRLSDDSTIVVYDSPIFAIPDYEQINPVIEDWIYCQNSKINKSELLSIIDNIREELSDTKYSSKYIEQIEDYSKKYDTDEIPIKLLKGKSCKFKELFNLKLSELYDVKIILSDMKSKNAINNLYPAFSKITYSKRNNDGYIFIPTDQNPVLGFHSLTRRVHMRYYRVFGENFIEDVLKLTDFPFSKFKQLSVYPFLHKYLNEHLN